MESASQNDLPQPGDTVVICCYCRGTGQIFSGGFKTQLMKNMTYAAHYFTVAGAKAITNYWDTYILSDRELRDMMEKNAAKVGGSIFEDSIELHSNGANWSVDFESQISQLMGCDAVTYMPVYVGLYFDDTLGAARVLEEYKRAEGKMYQENHIEYINRWAAGFGYSYRAQAGMAGINSIGANTATGITEGDNGTFKDANRRLAGCVNMVPEKKFLSFESNTFTGFPFPWSLLGQDGLTVIFDGCVPSRVFGLEQPGKDNTVLKSLMARLTKLDNVHTVSGQDALISLLKQLDLTPAAAYQQKNLEATHLQDASGDYYAFYNDTLKTISVPVQLSGKGVLVQMDCWTGEYLPVETEDMAFTLELAPQDMKFFAVLPELPASVPCVAVPMEPISVSCCDVTVESFGPALEGNAEYDPACPIESHKETISFTNVPLGTIWSQLPATPEQLSQLRVDTMADVSGRAWYTMEINLPEDVKAIEVAVDHNEKDFLVGGSINGETIGAFNVMEDKKLITEGLKAGKNTLVLNLDSILTNRLNFESPKYLATADLSLMSFGGGTREYVIRHPHGLNSVTVTPYI